MDNAVLRAVGVSKSFGDVVALDAVSIEFFGGEVHAVLGENGAGKSTLMGVLGGFIVPNAGSVELYGAPLPLGRQRDAISSGVRMVHQHFMLIEGFTVAENLALASMDSPRGDLDLESIKCDASNLLESLGWRLDFDSKVERLPVGERQRIEVVKALLGESRVLILDEPTAVLSPEETNDLFGVLRRLREAGTCIILIAHKLKEVLQIADRFTVLRHGSLVATAPRDEVDEHVLAHWMVGEPVTVQVPSSKVSSDEVLRIENISALNDRGVNALDDVSLTINRSEIIGIGGVEGNGQSELAEIVAGIREPTSGTRHWGTAQEQVAYVPPDRHAQGLALAMSVEDNVLIQAQHEESIWRGAFLKRTELEAKVSRIVDRYAIKLATTNDAVASLSGGNQQKVVVGRALDSNPDLIVANNPTRGLDLKASAQVRGALLGAASRGAAVLLVSSDREELAETTTRIKWISRGRLYDTEAEALGGGAT